MVPLLHDFLSRSASRLPEKIALVCGQRRVSYRELEARSNALAAVLGQRGIQRGDRVIVFADNTVETVISFWAVLKANAVVSLINPLTKEDKLAWLLNDCQARALITDGHLGRIWVPAAKRSEHLVVTICSGTLPVDSNAVAFEACLSDGEIPPARKGIDIDLAAIIYTSGSTGDPKGVMLTHRNMLTASSSISQYLGVREDEVILGLLPLAFDYGLYQMIMAFQNGARLVLERSFTYPAEVLQRVVDEKVTGFPGVPTIFAI